MRTTTLLIEGLPPVARCQWAVRPWDRLRGLLGRRGLAPGEAMAFPRCNAVHTLGMRFAIDVAFLDRAGRLVRLVPAVPPGRLLVWGGWRARTTVEAAAGAFAPVQSARQPRSVTTTVSSMRTPPSVG